jgi:hypothetical protein
MMFSLLKKSYKWLGLAIITVILAITPAAIAQSTTSAIPLAKINWLQAIFLGFVQGVTEFLPISSTAHLKAIPVFLGWGDSRCHLYSSDSIGQYCGGIVLFLAGFKANIHGNGESGG